MFSLKFVKVFLITLFLLPLGISAQIKGVINYKAQIQSPAGIQNLDFITYFNEHKSIEFGVRKYNQATTDTISQTESRGEYKRVVANTSKKELFVLKDFVNKKLVLGDNIMFNIYYISDSLNNFKWHITTEHKQISNYNCTKATLNFRGRDYTAWFAEAIPLPFGPWKFCGLPGLIIKIFDQDEKFVYELSGIDLKAKFDDQFINVPAGYSNDLPITHQKFMSIYDTKVEHYKKMSRVVISDANGASGTNAVTLAEKQEKF